MKDSPGSSDFFKIILSSIADGVFTVNSDRIITSFNRAAEKITGIPASQAINKYCQDVFHSDICDNCLLKDTLETGIEAIDRPVNIINSQGDKIPISISTAVLRNDEGKILGAVETFRDLSVIEHLRKELYKNYSLEDIISKSPKMHKLFAILPDFAESESTVLIQGPSGSGKELFARAIHNLSPRKNENYVVINCGTLPVQLFESELFGYVQGAFTDAKKDKKGKLDGAEGGTVFFDEIGELPLSTQVKLLRLLQEKEYEPLGSISPKKVNIRVVAATNSDLKKLVAQAKFRDDLYFRLAVVKIELPPLKDKREDIPLLVDHFIRRFNAKTGKKIISVSPNVMTTLMAHNFPGNVRELENIIEHAFVLCRGSIIQRNHLPPDLFQTSAETFTIPYPASTPITESINEQIQIINTLRNCGGVISKAAKALAMHRTTLWRKIKRYHIEVKEI
jgi:PAS domain S-box-containing protein